MCTCTSALSSTLSLRKSRGEERGPAMSFMMFPALIVCAVEHGKRGKIDENRRNTAEMLSKGKK